MDRRQFLTRAMGIGAGGAMALGMAPAQAGLACYPVHSAKSRCVVGLPQIPPLPAQPCRGLSWATCLSYLIAGYGAKLDAQAVQDRYGIEDVCALDPEADLARLMAAAGRWRDRYGRRFLVETERLPDLAGGVRSLEDIQRLVTRLSTQPVLCGSAGHTTLLTELAYIDGFFTKLQIKGATVRDPWDETGAPRDLSAEELKAPAYLVAINVRAL